MSHNRLAIAALVLLCVTFSVAAQRRRTSRTKPSTTTSQPAAAQPAANTKTLTRPRAAELIKMHPTFKGLTEVDLPTGSFWYDWRSIGDIRRNNIQPLVDAGLVTFRETGKSDSVWYHEYVVEFTPEGEAAAKSWRKEPDDRKWVLKYQGPVGILSPNVVLYNVPVAERQLIAVTGIAFDPSGMNARVEFTWKWVPTANAKYLPDQTPSDQAHGGQVAMQLYHDGWRMGQMLIGWPYYQ